MEGGVKAAYSCIIAWESISRQALIFRRRHTQQRFSDEKGATSAPQTTHAFRLRSGRAGASAFGRAWRVERGFVFFAICFQLSMSAGKDQSPAAGSSATAARRRASQAFTSST